MSVFSCFVLIFLCIKFHWKSEYKGQKQKSAVNSLTWLKDYAVSVSHCYGPRNITCFVMLLFPLPRGEQQQTTIQDIEQQFICVRDESCPKQQTKASNEPYSPPTRQTNDSMCLSPRCSKTDKSFSFLIIWNKMPSIINISHLPFTNNFFK